MRPQLLHLSGPLRGRTITYDDPALEIGAAKGIDLRLTHPAVAPRHLVIEYHEPDCAFHLRRLDGRSFVNRQEVEEVILQDGDLIELGEGGPRLRFRAYVPPGRVCKPVRRMLADARDVQRTSGHGAAIKGLTRDLLTQATNRLKVGFPLLVLAVALPLAWLAGWLGARPLRAKLRADEVTIAELEQVRAEQAQQRAELEKMLAANAVLRRVQSHWSRGVCLVHGIVALRWSGGALVVNSSGATLLGEYTGSGFLVGGDGKVLTNRHVVTPWEVIPDFQPYLQRGALPEFAHLTATFPGTPPIAVPIDSIERRRDGVDVALFRVPADAVGDVPVLPLHDGPLTDLPDQRAIVVGYPTGLDALMAKADNNLVAELQGIAADQTTVIARLAAAGCIVPAFTEGIIGNVRETMIEYDAPTVHGGSGGPVFGSDGTVIAVNYAFMPEFSGLNFGVPIRFGRELLAH